MSIFNLGYNVWEVCTMILYSEMQMFLDRFHFHQRENPFQCLVSFFGKKKMLLSINKYKRNFLVKFAYSYSPFSLIECGPEMDIKIVLIKFLRNISKSARKTLFISLFQSWVQDRKMPFIHSFILLKKV